MSKSICLSVVLTVVSVFAHSVHADPSECMQCHTAGELKGRDAAAVQKDLADPAIPPHRKFKELTEVQIAEILEAIE